MSTFTPTIGKCQYVNIDEFNVTDKHDLQEELSFKHFKQSPAIHIIKYTFY